MDRLFKYTTCNGKLLAGYMNGAYKPVKCIFNMNSDIQVVLLPTENHMTILASISNI